MSRAIAFSLVALPVVAGCASTSYPAPVELRTRPAPPSAQASPQATLQDPLFVNAPGPTIFSSLFVCGPNASNAGPVNDHGESLTYTPYLYVGTLALMRNPTQGACLSSGFGLRARAEGGGKNHSGIDLANPNGGFIYSGGAGRVFAVGPRGEYGLAVELDHGDGVHTLYGHLSQANPALVVGAWAPAGAAIARMGKTGNATGVHLHYEVSIDGLKVDPLTYGASPSPQETPPGAAPEPAIEPPLVSR